MISFNPRSFVAEHNLQIFQTLGGSPSLTFATERLPDDGRLPLLDPQNLALNRVRYLSRVFIVS